MKITREQFKQLAKNLHKELEELKEIPEYSYILESFSKSLGFKDFNALSEKETNKFNHDNSSKIEWEEFKNIVKKTDFDYKKLKHNDFEEDKDKYIKNLDMTLYDFCNLFFKRTYESRRYSDDTRYFDLGCFDGHKVLTITKTSNPSFFVIQNDDTIKNRGSFEVIVYNHKDRNICNIVLRYKCASHFVLDLFDFIEESYRLSIHPEELKNMFLFIFSIEKPLKY